ncbi:putative metallophosphoesterase 1, partial [Operophtera brumata]
MDFQCSWPVLKSQNSDALKALILADTHLLGPRKGHWLDKWRREWQMHRSFQTIITLHQPDAVFLLDCLPSRVKSACTLLRGIMILDSIIKKLICSQGLGQCEGNAPCTEPDAPPLPERNKPFRMKIDALSKHATDYLATKIKPRAVFGGHTHHGCRLQHSYGDVQFEEHSVPSFSWRNRPDPKFML